MTDKNWAMLCHLTAFTGYFIPFGNIIGPLVIWLIKKGELAVVDENGKESLNFQISMTIYTLIAVFLMFLLIGFILMPVCLIANLVLVIVAGVRVNRGDSYRYPWSIRFLKPWQPLFLPRTGRQPWRELLNRRWLQHFFICHGLSGRGFIMAVRFPIQLQQKVHIFSIVAL